ncbi:MAG: TonB-dependent receptor [Flavobacteriia bacterium]|jgi:TonB-linked SusC/RagA family outer membrane protein|nr:TonB-dependent receptor [Flavobacteriia bacterium]
MKPLFILLSLSLTFFSMAQNRTVTGKIINDANEPLGFAKITSKSPKGNALSQADGTFSMVLKDTSSAKVSITFYGYEPQELTIGPGSQELNVVMKPAFSEKNEITVIGYGEAKNKTLTGATSKVDGEDIEKMNMSRMDQALQGQMAGVNISTNSGSPGGSANIRIRGLGTFGDNDPLILVDGIVYDSQGLNALNPSDIKSITVLKDAMAGIYGVRAANGVVLIETKNGAINRKPTIEYNGYFGLQETSKKLDLLRADEYAVIKNEMFAMGGQAMPFNNVNVGKGTDWQDQVFTRSPLQSHNISLNGGTLATRYSIGLGYFNQDGIVGGAKSHFDRYNARLNFSTDLSDKLKLNSVLLFSSEGRNTLPENGIGSVLYNAINAFPTEPVISPMGNYSYMEEVSDIINPVAQIMNTYNWNKAQKFVGKEEFIFKPLSFLTFTNRFNYNVALVDSKVFSPLVWYGDGKYANTALNAQLVSPTVELATGVEIDRGAAVYEERNTYTDLSYEGFVNYDQIFAKDHQVKATAGVTIFQRDGKSLNGVAYGIPNNDVTYADISANTTQGGFLNNTGSWEFTERLVSAFMRAEYAFKEKYLVSAVVRRDGSSKFGPNSRFGTFPSFSAGWLISEESFFKFKPIDLCKLRVSYGISGNDQIPNFAYRALLNGEGVYVFDDVITQGVAIGRPANPDLKWETTRQLNIGLDVSFWKKLSFSTNYFIKNTYDLLFQPDVSALMGSYGPGGYPPVINAGNVSNKGWEIELGYRSDRTKQFLYEASWNFTAVNNKVTEVPVGVDYLPGAAFSVGGDVATRFQKGYEIGYFFGYQAVGIYQTQEEIDNAQVVQQGAKPGDLIFADINGDGIISFTDDSDKTNLGSAIPDFIMGFNLSSSYKGFDVSANFFASVGNEIIRNYERQQPYANQLSYTIDRWVGPESSFDIPRQTTEPTRNNVFSSFYVEDGSFLRLRNLQLGYSFSKDWLRKIKMEQLRVYLAANNLFTLTKYMGYDPDLGSSSALSAGVDYGMYPQAKTIMVGLQFKF